MNKVELYERGVMLLNAFCETNNINPPEIRQAPRDDWRLGTCAYYRPSYIAICVTKCASVGKAGPAWSYPGYVVDRTPYGVLQHELGHHIDHISGMERGPYFSDYSVKMRAACAEHPITTYCPNDAEWFAEMFRLFVTNPDLLRAIRPLTYEAIRWRFQPVHTGTWREMLADAPDRYIKAAERKISA